VKKILEDPLILDKVTRGELMVVGAFYEISSGLVDFFEYTDAELQRG
jgi:carbonic anhydrase